jgi:hypothetical protein
MTDAATPSPAFGLATETRSRERQRNDKQLAADRLGNPAAFPGAETAAGPGTAQRRAAQVPESLFDDLRRTDDRPALFDEPTFRFLNRRAGPSWQRVRDLLDEWFSRVPGQEARADLRGRLQSRTEVDFRSAFFETATRPFAAPAGAWSTIRSSPIPQGGRTCALRAATSPHTSRSRRPQHHGSTKPPRPG